MAREISKILFILGSYNFLAYLECVGSYAWSKGHSYSDLSSVYEFLSAGFKFAVLVIKEEFLEITYLIFSRNKVEIKIIIDHFSAYKSKE